MSSRSGAEIATRRRRALRERRPSTSAAGRSSATRRPLLERARRRSRSTVRRFARIPRSRSRSEEESARSETPPSGAGEIAASAPDSSREKASRSEAGAGGTSPPTMTARPHSAAARRATSSRRAPRESPRWSIQPSSDVPASARRQAGRSSGGVATASLAPAPSAVRAQPRANCRKSCPAPGARSPFSRAWRSGSRANRTRRRATVPILRWARNRGLPAGAPKNTKAGDLRLPPSERRSARLTGSGR